MAKPTTTTKSLTKTPANRGNSVAPPRANRRRERNAEKQREGGNPVRAERRIARGGSSSEAPKRPTKQEQVAALLLRDEGATIAQMIAATGWLPHTVRAALTGLKKKGYAIDSDKVGDVRTYRAIAPQ